MWAIALLLLSGIAVAGELRWAPEKPQRGTSISVEYIPDSARFAPGEPLWLYAYEFDAERGYPTLQEVELEYQRTRKLYAAAFRLDTATVFVLCKVGNGRTFDTRGGRFWEILVHCGSGPCPEALLRAALSRFGTLQDESWRRAPDLWEAERLLQRVVELRPEHFAARVWLLAVRGRLRKLERAAQQQQLRELLAQPYPETEGNMRAALWALNVLGESDRMEQLEERILKEFPTWELGEEILLVRLNRAAVAQQYYATAERFLRMFPNSPGYEHVYVLLVRALLQNERPGEVEQLFRRFPRVPAAAYAELVRYWLDRRESQKAAPWVRLMMARFQEQRMGRMHRKPRYRSTVEWSDSDRLLHAQLLALQARFLRQERRVEEAIERYREAWSAYGDRFPAELAEELVEALRVLGQHKNAFGVCTEALLQSRDSDTLWAQFRELFLQVVEPDSARMQAEMLRLQEHAAQLRRAKLWSERLDWDPPTVVDSLVYSLTGDSLRLSQLRGKVVLVDLWATWCQPCLRSFPSVQKLWELYREREDVAFVVLNVWERAPDRQKVVQEFLHNNPQYTFPVYLDPADIVPLGFGVTGIPTQLYLDRSGRLQFRSTGFSSEELYLRDMQDRLEALLQQQ